MKNNRLLIFLGTTAFTTAALAELPTPSEIHQHIYNGVKSVRDALVPEPVTRFVETFPPIAVPRAAVLHLAQATPPSAPPPTPAPPSPLDAGAIADWANNFAVATTERALGGFFPGKGARKPLIVSASERDAKSIAQLDEDLNVMMRILEKSANTRDEARVMGIDVFTGQAGSPRVMYLENYGALFVLRVKYPLLPPPAKDDQSRTNENPNSEWEKARQEVYGTRNPFEDRLIVREGPAEEFDADRVEKLKSQLLDDLANATHIRTLKADDFVTIVVMGAGGGGIGRASVYQESQSRRGGGRASAGVFRGAADGAQSTMTLRAKKSDIDSFAAGKLKSEEFRKKVAIQTY